MKQKQADRKPVDEAAKERQRAKNEAKAAEQVKRHAVWRAARVPLLVALVAVFAYEVFENLSPIMAAIGSVLSILWPVFIGVMIAFITNMPMRFLENKVFKKWEACSVKRALCLFLSVLFVLIIVGAVIFLVTPRMVESIGTLAKGLDDYIARITVWGNEIWDKLEFNPEVEARVQLVIETLLSQIDEALGAIVTSAARLTVSVVSTTIRFFLAFVISIYALFNKEKLIFQGKKAVVAVFSERRAARVLEVCTRTNTALNRYFYGMIIECTILGVLCFIGMTIFRFPYALLISVVVGVTQIVPIIGPWVSALFGALIMLVVDPSRVLWFLVLIIAVQQIEVNVFYPRVVGNAVGLSGIWVMIAVILGSGLFGFMGIVLCVPVMAVLYTLASEWINRRVEEKRFAKGMRPEPPTEEEIEAMTESEK